MSIFEISLLPADVWGPRIDALTRVIGPASLRITDVFRRARRVLGWSRRRTRCVLAAGEQMRFTYDKASRCWSVVQAPLSVTEWSAELSRWVPRGLDDLALREWQSEIHQLMYSADFCGEILRRGVVAPDVKVSKPKPRPKRFQQETW